MNMCRRDFVLGSAALAAADALAVSSVGESPSGGLAGVSPDEFAKDDEFRLFENDWGLVCAGKRGNFNMLTVSCGTLGSVWGRKVATIYIHPSRYTHEYLEREDRFTISFFGGEWKDALMLCGTKSGRDTDKCAATGLKGVELASGAIAFGQARWILDCRKIFKAPLAAAQFTDRRLFDSWYGPGADVIHDVYIGEIEAVYGRRV